MLGSLSNETGCRVVVIHHARKPTEDGAGGRYAIRGSGAIYDGVDGAYIFGANKGEPVSVEHVKARSHGELVDDFALVISDVELDGNPKAGLSVSVRGGELITELRANRAKAARTEQVRRDAKAVREAVAARPGVPTMDLRAATGLSGDRYASAMASLAGVVEVRERKDGRSVRREHYLRGAP
jgi:hypothetical protein